VVVKVVCFFRYLNPHLNSREEVGRRWKNKKGWRMGALRIAQAALAQWADAPEWRGVGPTVLAALPAIGLTAHALCVTHEKL
jgi:hypothetical protein